MMGVRHTIQDKCSALTFSTKKKKIQRKTNKSKVYLMFRKVLLLGNVWDFNRKKNNSSLKTLNSFEHFMHLLVGTYWTNDITNAHDYYSISIYENLCWNIHFIFFFF